MKSDRPRFFIYKDESIFKSAGFPIHKTNALNEIMERWFIPAQQCDEQTMAPYNFKIFAEHKLGQRFNGDKAEPRICRNRRVPVSEIKVIRRVQF